MSRPTLAVALIVKNEAAHLEQCLETVHDWVDEVVILDSGSTDNTEAIAKLYTDRRVLYRRCQLLSRRNGPWRWWL